MVINAKPQERRRWRGYRLSSIRTRNGVLPVNAFKLSGQQYSSQTAPSARLSHLSRISCPTATAAPQHPLKLSQTSAPKDIINTWNIVLYGFDIRPWTTFAFVIANEIWARILVWRFFSDFDDSFFLTILLLLAMGAVSQDQIWKITLVPSYINTLKCQIAPPCSKKNNN